MNPFGFDVSRFVPEATSSPLSAAIAGIQATTASQGISAELAKLALDQKMAREQREAEMAELQETLAQDSEKAAFVQYGENQRKSADIEAAQAKFRAEQAAKQRETEGSITGDAAKAFAIGDVAALEALKTRAATQAPALKFNDRVYRDGLNPMGLADPYSDLPGLSIARGDETLFSGDTAEQRRQQQEIARAALDPLSGGSEASSFAPFISAGIGMAGLGKSGLDSAKDAMKFGSDAAKRDASRDNARSIQLSRTDAASRGDAQASRQYWAQLDKMAKDQAKRFETDVGLNAARSKQANFAQIRQMVASGTPLSQNMGLLQVLKNSTTGAVSDYETRNMYESAGALNRFEMTLDRYLKGGELPKNFQEQLLQTLDLLDESAGSKIKQTGIKAMDGVYASPGFIAMVNTPEEAAMFGLQTYQDVTGEPPSQEDIQQEADRIRPMFMKMKGMLSPAPGLRGSGAGGSTGGSVRMTGDIVPRPPEGDNLGVAPAPGPRPIKPSPEELQKSNRQRALDLLNRHRNGQ